MLDVFGSQDLIGRSFLVYQSVLHITFVVPVPRVKSQSDYLSQVMIEVIAGDVQPLKPVLIHRIPRDDKNTKPGNNAHGE